MFKVFSSLSLLVLAVFVISLYDFHAENQSVVPGDSAKVNHREQMHRIIKRAVRVEYVCGLQPMGRMGSGVVVEKNAETTLIATAKHVIDAIEDEGCDIVVRDWRGFSGYGKLMKSDESSDLALVEVGEPIGEVAGLYRGAYLGQAISCVGWPVIPYNDVDLVSITRGYVSTVFGEYLRVSADLFFGNSGGACFSKSGDVVGIVSFFYGSDADGIFDLPTPRPGQFYISDVENLKILLD